MALDIELETTESTYTKLLGQPPFRRFFLSQVMVSIGDGFFGVMVTFLALAMGASVGTLGIVAFCVTFPRGILGILGGAVADHYDRKKLMVFCDWVRGSGVLILALLLHMNALSIFWLTFIGAIVTSTYAVSKPASKAFVPSLVRKKELTLANGLVQSVLWPCFFLGAGLVGGLSALNMTPANSLIICALLFFCSQTLLTGIKAQTPHTIARTAFQLLQQLHTGWIELLSHRALMVRITGYFFYTVAWRGTLQIALPLYAVSTLEQPATFYSSLMVACGIGELVSSLVIGKLRIANNLKLAFCGEIILALALLVLVASAFTGLPAMPLAFIASVLIGLSATVIDIPLITAIQTQIDDDKSGKIFSYWSALGALGGSIGILIISGLISVLGLDISIAVIAAGLVIAAVVAYGLAYRGGTR
ncbi:MFS transporter [Pseudomonas sp. PB3P13]